jgi:2-desacetyl-2-hydroxyethyl bacteriochlorophyllide A dehydrogenase
MTSAKTLVCPEPGQLRLEHREIVATAGMALVRPRRVGICGTDFHIFGGKHPFLQYPRVMGHELAVEVVEAEGFAPGEICAVNPYLSCGTCRPCLDGKPNCCERIAVLGVHRDGGMAELLVLPAANLIAAQGLSLDHCAAVEFLAIGAHAARRAGTAPGDRALVIGAGPIGIGTALFARLAGAEVTLADVDPERLAQASRIAGSQALLSPEAREEFDLVFDATGNAASIEAAFGHVAHGGRLVLVSVVKDRISFADPDFHRREMTLIGSRNATDQDFQRVMAAMRSGDVPLGQVVTHRTTLDGAVSDLPRWTHDKSGLIKALIDIGD